MEKIRAFKIMGKLVPTPLYVTTIILQAHLSVKNKDGEAIFEGLCPPVNKTR